MPRNQSGTYTLPSGNPVSAGTLIDANWANNTLNDMANEMTDSLSRSGEGGMLAPFRITDGLQATPSLAFTNEPSTGLYRAGTNEMWAVVGGTQITQFTATGMAGRFAAGAVTTPSITVHGDLNTGIYFPGADQVAIATGGVQRLSVDASGGVSVPGTFSVTGNVTIDTNTLFVDAANNRVGVGTVTPAVKLDVAGGISIGSADNLTWGGAYGATTPAISGAAGFLAFYPNGSTSGEQMRLNSTGLGIGTSSPAAGLHINKAFGSQFRIQEAGGTYFDIAAGGRFDLKNAAGTTIVSIAQSGSPVGAMLNLDSSGNLGLGVTPSATTVASFQSTWGHFLGNNQINVAQNAYFNSGWKYFGSAAASLYYQDDGQHQWHTAASGTAGNTITFTQAMTLTADGNLGVGTTSPALFGGYKTIDINGSTGGLLALTSNGTNKFQMYVNGSSTTLMNVASEPLIFGTNNTERARITSGGLFYINTTGLPAGNGYLSVATAVAQPAARFYSSGGDGNICVMVDKSSSTNTTSQWFLGFTINAQATASGVITANGASQAAFGSWSDQRLKKNIVDIPSQWANIKALRPVEFDYIESEGGGHQTSFIAQEFEQVYPDAIGERPDGMKTLTGWGKTEARLVKVLQEAMSRIESLEAKVAALEAK